MSTPFESRREYRRNRRHSESNRVLVGFFILIAGGALFLRNMHLGFPDWIFSWETLMIGLGLYFGIKHKFRGPLWIIFLMIGFFSLQDELFPFINIRAFLWPAILVTIGLYFILRPKRERLFDAPNLEPVMPDENLSIPVDDGDTIDVTSIFGSVKKVVVSKNFKGGDVVSFLGGSDINLTQADINGRVKLDATSIMGGTKLIVPSNWDVQSEMVAIFGGVEDKRDLRSVIPNPTKILVIEGTCIFGGLEIRSH